VARSMPTSAAVDRVAAKKGERNADKEVVTNMVEHRIACKSPEFESVSSPADGQLNQLLAGLPLGIGQPSGLTSWKGDRGKDIIEFQDILGKEKPVRVPRHNI
jgi:hypothetical protein